MKLPNKLYTYKDSVISKFPIVLNILKLNNSIAIYDLYIRTFSEFESISEFIETIECLYILGKIDYNYELRRVYYAI